MVVCFECCVLSGRGLCDGLITRPEQSYRLWCVLVCDLGTSRMRRLRLIKGCKCRIERETRLSVCLIFVWFGICLWLFDLNNSFWFRLSHGLIVWFHLFWLDFGSLGNLVCSSGLICFLSRREEYYFLLILIGICTKYLKVTNNGVDASVCPYLSSSKMTFLWHLTCSVHANAKISLY